MHTLKPHQYDLLRFLVARNSPVPVSSLDGRNLRPLKSQHLVAEVSGCAVPTEAGRALAQSSAALGAPGALPTGRLTDRQEEVLRYLIRQSGPVPEDHLDGRVLRALRSQGLVVERTGWISPSETARARLATHLNRPRSRRGGSDPLSSARAGAILRAAEQLEASLPRDAEIRVGDMPAYADDILLAVRRFARALGTGASQRQTGSAS